MKKSLVLSVLALIVILSSTAYAIPKLYVSNLDAIGTKHVVADNGNIMSDTIKILTTLSNSGDKSGAVISYSVIASPPPSNPNAFPAQTLNLIDNAYSTIYITANNSLSYNDKTIIINYGPDGIPPAQYKALSILLKGVLKTSIDVYKSTADLFPIRKIPPYLPKPIHL